MSTGPPARRWLVRSLWAAGALVLLAALLVVAVHTPPVRSAVLRRMLSEIERRYDVALQASQLRYNLLSLRIGLDNVRVAVVPSRDEPFLTADRIDVAVARSALLGAFSLKSVTMENARVTVLRRADGRMNVPSASGDGREPSGLPIDLLLIPWLSFSYIDFVNGLNVTLPALAVEVGPGRGTVALGTPGRVQRGQTQTDIARLDGSVTFDGRNVEFSGLEVRSTEGTVTLDGTLAVLVSEPAATLRVAGAGDVGALARWATNAPPTGSFVFDGFVEGPLAAPSAIARVREGVVTVESIAFSDVTASITVNRQRLAISQVDAVFAGGRITAEGQVPFESGEADLSARWEALDVAALVTTLAPAAGVVASARATGSASFRGPLDDMARWGIEARTRFDAGRSGPGQVAVAGDARLGVENGAWNLASELRLGGAPVSASLRGVVYSPRMAHSTVAGTISLRDTSIPVIAQALRTSGFIEGTEEPIDGVIAAEAALAGTLSSPRFQVSARGRDITGAGVSGMAVEATGRGAASDMSFAARISQGDANSLIASGTVWPANRRIDARVKATLAEPSRLTRDHPVGGLVNLQFDAAGTFDALVARGTVTVDDARYDDVRLGPLNAAIVVDPAAARVELVASELAAEAVATLSRTGDSIVAVDIVMQEADLARLVRDARLPVAIAGRVSLAAHAEGRFDAWRAGAATVEVSRFDATAGELPIELRAPGTLSYADSTIDVRRLDLTAGKTSIALGGRLPLFADTAPVAAADALRATLAGEIEHALEAVRATGLVDVPDAGATGPLVLLARVSGSAERPVLAGDLELGPGRVVIARTGAADRLPLIASGEAAGVEPPDGSALRVAQADTTAVRLNADTTVVPLNADTTTVRVNVDTTGGRTAGQEQAYAIESVQVRAHLEDGWLDLLNASAEWQGSVISAEGRAPLGLLREYIPQRLAAASSAATGEASLTARVTNIGPQALAPFVSPETLADMDGAVALSAQLNADALALESIEGAITVETLDVHIADLPISQRVPTRITFDDGVARIAAWDWVGQGASLGVQGQIRLADRETSILASGRVDLRTLTPFLRDAGLTIAGTLVPQFGITGPLDSPSLSGEVALANAEVGLAAPRIVASGISAKAVVSGSGADITAITGSVNGGQLTGLGRVSFGRGEAPAARLDFDIAGLALEFPAGLRSELDAELSLALTARGLSASGYREPARRLGEEGTAGRLSGTVTVLRSAYREPIAVVTGLLAALRSNRLTAATSTPETFAGRLALDVRVVTDSDVIVDNNIARLRLGGDLRVIGTAAAPSLSGRAELREGGELRVGTNRYEILENSTIDFDNPDEIEPNLNIRATTAVAGVEIQLTLTGTPEAPGVNLDAPEQPDLGQPDLASLLLTGRDLQGVSGAEAEIVREQVLSYLAGDLLGAAGRLVGLDTIRFGGVEDTLRRDPASIATETDPTSRMTFGKAIGDALEITLSQSLREADAQTWIVDYRALRQLGLRFVSDDDHMRSYEFSHDVTFGTSPARASGAARPRPVPARVDAVAIRGNAGPLEGRLRTALSLDPGDTFDFAEWQRDRDRLEEALHEAGYREAQVDAVRQESGAGVALSYDVDLGPPTRIVTTGYSLGQDVLDAIHTAWTQSVFDDFLEEETAALARDALAADGYLEAAVAAELATETTSLPDGSAPRDTKTLTIAVAPGQRTTNRRIVVDASNDQLEGEIESWVRRQGLAEIAWRKPASLERAIVSYLESRGYLTASATTAAPAAEGVAMVLRVAVDAGPAFAIGEVAFAGARRLDSGVLRSAAALENGSPYAAEAVNEARRRVLQSCRDAGFADARVAVEQAVEAGRSRVNVVFTIDEGPRQVLRDVVVAGNQSIAADVITRALDLTVGEPLGADSWIQARSRLFDTALFRRVDVETTPIADAPPVEGERPVRVVARVQEWPALRLRYGFQVSEERPEGEVEGTDLVPGFSAQITRRTLFGRAISTGGSLEYQRRERDARLFASVPTLFGLPVESIFTASRSRKEFVDSTLLTDRTGMSWEQRIRIGSPLTLSYTYGYERAHTFETNPNPDDFLPDVDDTVNIARFSAAAVYDTRDDPLDSTRGLQLSSNVEYSADPIGSDVSFLKQLAQAYHFRPWRQVVFASAARLGLAAGLGGQTLIPSERFFAGGARTVRGAREAGLGPRDFLGHAAGGGALLVFNQEVRFPLFRWFRGVGFVDAGNVFTTPAALKLGDLVTAAGLGLRVTTPFALLRVDHGRVWSGMAIDGGRWTFGIGQAF